MDYTYEQLNEYPLRILVPSDSVGAIIGKQGSIVKQIKQNTHAKIDVNKNGSAISHERVIVIRGQPDNCIQACQEIMKIMNVDAKNKNKTNEIVLKVLAHNSFIGRIIGKGGNIINTIKQETDTNITVSSINELDSSNPERIISIKGEIEQQISALENIYQKLCAAFDADQARGWNYPSYPTLSYYQQHPQQLIQYYQPTAAAAAPTPTGAAPALVPTHYSPTQMSNPTASTSNKFIEPTSNSTGTFYPPIYPNPNPFYMPYPTATSMIPATFYTPAHVNGEFVAQQQYGSQYLTNTPVATETVHLYVPNVVIGAIIGTKGLFIRSIMKNSNASVKVTPISPDEDPTKIVDRDVVISGTPEAQWKSQYYIFDKIFQEGYFGDDEVRLRAEIYFPTSLIGRLIGKGGQNIRQIQQSTGAMIKLPEDSQQTSASEIPVSVLGNFQASQFAQRRIQSIIQMSRLAPATTTASTDEHSNPSGVESSNVETVKNHLNETSTMTNGSVSSDDAVVASSTLPNTDHSVTVVGVDEQKSTDQ